MTKVVYFGVDSFSVRCLRRILGCGGMESLDIVTKSAKPAGRYRKALQETPIAEFALDKQLPLHRADTGDDIVGLLAKTPFDLCIAVSYGKLIPGKFLDQLRYGGINVHPSLLPRYSGPAPLHRALLNGDNVTGCTIQTLHPTEFDRGHLIAQQKYTLAPSETVPSLSDKLADLGGDMLKNLLESGIYKDPSQWLGKSGYEFSHAPKVEPFEKEILWTELSSDEILRKFHILGALYSYKRIYDKKKKEFGFRRVVLTGLAKPAVELNAFTDSDSPGTFKYVESKLHVKTLDSSLEVLHLTFQGEPNEMPGKFMTSLAKRTRDADHNVFEHDPTERSKNKI
ncbi:unnamed protein product [Kuraishia capsulata CBS 1993]|uniref:methionyl-tRNA formyltransferase n=1 Tax=Kuraishia capsulata CBS 1993 TaxID=1382522 RepID=W6MRR9_9ASCO|nr:uncharacterized protein KUCA_T00000468001 [Kuraishia capsulata CBS 1993]CDK24505.1 unnamed protein product [Kuraishia capsulata CBS 1993]